MPYLVFRSKLVSTAKYRPEIDGLRAVAVLSVLFFHAKIAGFSGGFVGVDVFYVISGYLITSIVAHDIAKDRFSFASFYERRMRRIFPALFIVVFATVFAACVLFPPKDLSAFGKSLIATTVFVSNVFFKWEGGRDGYFGHNSDLKPLLHTWSLSVEEQFYLFFPMGLVLLSRWSRKRTIQCLWLAVILSFLINVWATRYKPLSAFYIFIPRAWELLIGSLLAMKAVPPLERRGAREIAGLVGLGLIVAAVAVFTRDAAFPGFYALLPCLGAWLIIYTGENGSSSVTTILCFRPLVLIGVISYSLYLWHWPILVFSKHFCAGKLTAAETAIALISSLLLAFVSFEFIESPFRGGDSPIPRQRIFSFGLAASLLSLSLGVLMYTQHGFPGRYNKLTRQLVSSNTDRMSDFQEVCSNWKNEINGIADINFCTMGSDSSRKIMFWGDSHVQQLYPLIQKIYDRGGFGDHGVVFAVANGCPLAEHLNYEGYHCDSFTHFAMMRAEEEDVDTVFIAFSTFWAVDEGLCASAQGRCVGNISGEEARGRVFQELAQHIQELKTRGKRLIVSLPFPFFDKSIPDLQIRNVVFGRFGLAGVATDLSSPRVREQVASVADSMGAELFDPRQSLCPNQTCITQVDGVSIYKDDNHLAASQIGILEGDIDKISW